MLKEAKNSKYFEGIPRFTSIKKISREGRRNCLISSDELPELLSDN